MHINKVHRVRVATDLGDHVEWLYNVASEMDVKDSVIWVPGDEGVMRSPTSASKTSSSRSKPTQIGHRRQKPN